MLDKLHFTKGPLDKLTIISIAIILIIYFVKVDEYRFLVKNLNIVAYHASFIENLYDLYRIKSLDNKSGIMSFEKLNQSFWDEKYLLDVDIRSTSISNYFSKEYEQLKDTAHQVAASMSYLNPEDWQKYPDRRFSLKNIKDYHLIMLSNLRVMSEKLIAANEKPDIWKYLTFIISILTLRASLQPKGIKLDKKKKSI